MGTPRPDAADRTEPTASAGSATSPAAKPVEDLTYEQAREELVAVVARLETGGETLEGSLALWERGEALAARCQAWLDGARARLDAAQRAADDASGTSDSDAAVGGTSAAGGGDAADPEETD